MGGAMEADSASAASRDAAASVVEASVSGDDDAPFEFAARLDQLSRDDARLQVEVRGRHLMLLRRGDEVFAMDATCYHMGAPLLHGDVEDVPGHGACITCPWHHYQISLGTGERLYQDMQRQICTLPKKQRVHETRKGLVTLFAGRRAPHPELHALQHMYLTQLWPRFATSSLFAARVLPGVQLANRRPRQLARARRVSAGLEEHILDHRYGQQQAALTRFDVATSRGCTEPRAEKVWRGRPR